MHPIPMSDRLVRGWRHSGALFRINTVRSQPFSALSRSMFEELFFSPLVCRILLIAVL